MRKYKISVFNHGLHSKPVPVMDLDVSCMSYDMDKLVAALHVRYGCTDHSVDVWEITETRKSVQIEKIRGNDA